jgi:beta-glucosidase
MAPEETFPFRDTSLPLETRVRDLIDRMTINEKITQTLYTASAIPRLGVPDYNWWCEALHGVARAGTATVFPQAIGLAATWDRDLVFQTAEAIAVEGRAKYHEYDRRGDHEIYKGLTFWSPNINIFRDPRWGRGHETYGECPFLTSRIGVAFITGLQGSDPKHLTAAACAKHYVVHSGPEVGRHSFDATVGQQDLYETYLPAFKAAVQEAKVAGVMGAYNRTNGEPCCASETLMGKILRSDWGFDGYYVSDCGAIRDIWAHHRVAADGAEAAAMAVRNGCDLNCGQAYKDLTIALALDLVSEAEIDTCLQRLFTIRFRLGMFDPPEEVAAAKTPLELNDCPEHHELSLQGARKSMVLLKNDGVLPLSKDVKTIAVIGPTADDQNVLLGNYFGTPSQTVTILEGIQRAVSPGTRVLYARGSTLYDGESPAWSNNAHLGLSEAQALADRADVVIVCAGLTPRMEGEEGDVAASDGGGDRLDVALPHCQEKLLKAIGETGKPVVHVLTGGSGIAINYSESTFGAILATWYPGQFGGTAVAELLFGDTNPSGRMPITAVKSSQQLPHFHDYSMQGRTYRYMTEEPLFPFGFGLSYTTFEYDSLSVSETSTSGEGPITVSARVRNTGARDGDEVVQLYVRHLDAKQRTPICQLRGFQRVHLPAGAEETVAFELGGRDFAVYTEEGHCRVQPGAVEITIGGRQPDSRSAALAGTEVLTETIQVTGSFPLDP